MDRPWEAENAISAAHAQTLIERQFSELSPVRLELVGVGWDNSVFRVNEELVFRFPRRELAVELIENERGLLAAVAERLPLPISVPLHHGEPDAEYPWPFNGYRWLPGRSACAARLSASERVAAARPLGLFLRALHATPADLAHRHGAGPDAFGRLELSKRREQIEERLLRARKQGLIDDDRPFLAVIADLPEHWVPRADVLVHGDLYARHVLVSDDGQPCGVIDWGDVHLGDPAVDLGLAHGFLPPEARAAFREAYGLIDKGDEGDEDTWRVARFKALHHATATLVYAHDVGDEDLAWESAQAVRHVLA